MGKCCSIQAAIRYEFCGFCEPAESQRALIQRLKKAGLIFGNSAARVGRCLLPVSAGAAAMTDEQPDLDEQQLPQRLHDIFALRYNILKST